VSRAPANLPASIRARLLNKAEQNREDFNLLLNRYGIERLLYRISQSPHRNRFILKGATLFTVWGGAPHRATRDLDLLGSGDASIAGLIAVFKEVCAIPSEDGLVFDPETVTAAEIRTTDEYGGTRLNLRATLDRARIDIQIDVAFGDAVTPKAKSEDFPTILELPAPRLRVYPRESVVAEKLEAIVKLGMLNSRLKDYYDLWYMSQRFEFDLDKLVAAVKATFERRGTTLPKGQPAGLSDEYAADRARQTQWGAFRRRTATDAPESLEAVIAAIRSFAGPVLAAAVGTAIAATWLPGGSWNTRQEG